MGPRNCSGPGTSALVVQGGRPAGCFNLRIRPPIPSATRSRHLHPSGYGRPPVEGLLADTKDRHFWAIALPASSSVIGGPTGSSQVRRPFGISRRRRPHITPGPGFGRTPIAGEVNESSHPMGESVPRSATPRGTVLPWGGACPVVLVEDGVLTVPSSCSPCHGPQFEAPSSRARQPRR